MLLIFVIFISQSFAQQWPAQVIPLNANGGRQSNTFPIGALQGQQNAFPGFQGNPFMQQQQQPQMGMPFSGQMPSPFGGQQQQQMPFFPVQQRQQMPSSFGGGAGNQQMQMPSFGGGNPFQRGFPSMNQNGGGMPFSMALQQRQGGGGGRMMQMPFQQQQQPRQFGQRQFQPMVSYQENSPPQQQQQQLSNSVQESSSGSLPKFLEGAPEETITEFKRIIRQPNITYDEKMKEVEVLVSKLDEPHQQLYRQFMEESDKNQQTKRDTIHKTVEGMSEDAQGQFAKISAILTNPSLPEEERWNRILTIYGSLEPSLRNEFEEKFKPLV